MKILLLSRFATENVDVDSIVDPQEICRFVCRFTVTTVVKPITPDYQILFDLPCSDKNNLSLNNLYGSDLPNYIGTFLPCDFHAEISYHN